MPPGLSKMAQMAWARKHWSPGGGGAGVGAMRGQPPPPGRGMGAMGGQQPPPGASKTEEALQRLQRLAGRADLPAIFREFDAHGDGRRAPRHSLESTLLYVLSHTTPHTNRHINKSTEA
jgi:hypothetical protein